MIFVVGPGRCGTSTIARLLHAKLGVSMGKRFRGPVPSNPDGFFEDLDFVELNRKFLNGRVVFDEWREDLKKTIALRVEPWGVKDPSLSYTIGHYLDLCPDAQVVRASRHIHNVALSMLRAYGWPYIEALQESKRRESFLDLLLVDRTIQTINFDSHRTDDELLGEIQCLSISRST